MSFKDFLILALIAILFDGAESFMIFYGGLFKEHFCENILNLV